ncbi:STY4528 family pathogenicity island replication protein [Pseudomonas aeruginosa]|uniref:STY4528 family pathogenicity island replication protein n=1 Tax=Pseudomonas aeruginosa TaxID=287 RepID=UPI00232C9091|nr:STY4528 family pathogenicity island replication protein [Pseudomonas aeruginosa]
MFDQTIPSFTEATAAVSTPPSNNVSVPLALLLDERLTPLERNAWMVFRASVGEDGTSALPNYEQMRPFLACKANNQKAAYETAARTVCVLRMTRWVHLVGNRRDPLTGQVQNTLYAVHNTPQTCQAVCASDADYIELLERSVSHPNHVVRAVATGVLQDLAADVDLPAALRQRIALACARSGVGSDDDAGGQPPTPKDESHLSSVHGKSVSTTSKTDSSVRTYKGSLKEVRIYRAGADESGQRVTVSPLRLPACLAGMAPDQHRDVQAALQRLPGEHRQPVLDELEARAQSGTVRNVVAYLFGLVRRVLAGEFRLWAAKKPVKVVPPSHPVSLATQAVARKPASPEVVRAHLALARSMLRMPMKAGDLAAELLQEGRWQTHPA